MNNLHTSIGIYLRRAEHLLWLPFISGILLALTLPIFGLWPLIFVALIPIIFFLTNTNLSRSRAVIGIFLTAFPCSFFVVLPLLGISGSWFDGGIDIFQGGVIGRLLFLPAVAVFGALLGALFATPFFLAMRQQTIHGAIFAASLWVCSEIIRSTYLLFGFSGGVFGYALVDMPLISYAARLPGGVLVLSFIIVYESICVVNLIRCIFLNENKSVNIRFSLRNKRNAVYSALFCIILLPLAGILYSRNSDCATIPERVAVISSDITTKDSIHPSAYAYFRARIMQGVSGAATIILLPENVFPFIELDEVTLRPSALGENYRPEYDVFYDDLLALSREYPSTTIALGLHTISGLDHYNSLVLIKNGAPYGIYHKEILVPFAEYAPSNPLLQFPSYEHLTAGSDNSSFLVNDIPTKGLICSEIFLYPTLNASPKLILSPSNDGVFSSQMAAKTHHSVAKMRALESGAYLLRSSKGGISSIIDPSGHVLAKATGDEVLFADIFPSCR